MWWTTAYEAAIFRKQSEPSVGVAARSDQPSHVRAQALHSMLRMTSEPSRETVQKQSASSRYGLEAIANDVPFSPSADGLGDPVLAVDAAGVVRYANEQAIEVLGWDSIDVIGELLLPLVHPDDVNLVTASMNTVTAKNNGHLLRVRVRQGRGPWTHL